MKSRLAMVRIVFQLVFLVVWVVLIAVGPAASAANHRVYLPLIMRPSGAPPGCALAPQLIAPADGSALDTLLPRFEWDSGNNPSATEFHLQVGYDQAFTAFEYRARSSGWAHGRWEHQPVLNLPAATTLYWRAYLTCGPVQGPYSAVWSFTTGSGGVVLPGPQLLSPANGSTLAGQEATVEWSPLPGAVGYGINYVDGQMHRATFVEDHSWVLSNLQPNTEYEWWVVARSDYAWGAESEHWTFTTGEGTE